MMASGRLPKPGTSGSFQPRNTMQNGLNAHERPSNPFHPTEERHTKRQKREDVTSSKYFSDKKPKPHVDVIEDDEGPEIRIPADRRKADPIRALNPEVFDLTQDGSQADSLEIQSATSTGKPFANASVEQFRKAQPPKVGTNRRRRRRSQTPGSSHPSQSESGKSCSTHNLLAPGAASFPATSPDILSQDDDPPPANIVSDLISQSIPMKSSLQNTKRVRRSLGGEGESEDELANTHSEGPKRPTNFSQLTSPRPRQRGDMHPTEFRPVRPASQGRQTITKLSNAQEYFEVTIAQAVSSKDIYLPKEDSNVEIKLRFEKEAEVAECYVNGALREIPWLRLQKSKVHSVFHAATRSTIIVIRRSASPGAPGILTLKFKTDKDTVCFFHWISAHASASQKTIEKDPGELDKTLATHLQHALTYTSPSVQLSPSNIPRQPQARPQNQATVQNFAGLGTRPLTEKLKDRMEGLPQDAPEEHSPSTVTRSRGIETRRTRRFSPSTQFYEFLPDRWTHKNPNWDKEWRMTLEFPANGRKRESVHKDDVARLDEGEFLNDNLINFYLRYLQAQLEEKQPEILGKVHFFNTFLFPTIKSGGANINYKGVEKWTAKIDLFSFKYIVVPINESLHWYLAIIYNAPKLLPETDMLPGPETIDVDQYSEKTPKSPIEVESEAISLENETTDPAVRSQSSTNTIEGAPQTLLGKLWNKVGRGTPSGGAQKFSPEEPRIITLDSLGSPHPATCRALKSYLFEEAKHKKNVELLTTPGGMTAKHIPAQDNHCDCGAFLLGYMEEFLKDPDEAIRRILQKEDVGWKIDASQVRTKVRDVIIKLQREYQSGEEEKKQEKRRQRKLAKQTGQSVPSSPREPPSEVSRTPQSKRDIRSPTANSHRSPAVLNLEKVFQLQESPKPASSSEKPTVLHRSILSNGSLPRPLEDDSSVDSKVSISTEAIPSARSSPKGAVQIPVDLTTENSIHAVQDAKAMPKFVQTVPSSPVEVNSGSRGIKRSRSETPEDVSLVQIPPPRRPKSSPIPPRSHGGAEQAIPSIEEHIDYRPQYDGIDRSQAMETCDSNDSGPVIV